MILAVGYGQFLMSKEKKCGGLVCCWSVKNPSQPERLYTFDSSVTALTFSSANPDLLLVGLYSGDIVVRDVSQPLTTLPNCVAR
jgi:WD40 repeat protein